jgi:excisionase family DNA binding protein
MLTKTRGTLASEPTSSGKVRGGDPALPPRLLSPQEAASYLGLGSRWAVRRLVVNGQLPVVKFAGKWRLDVRDLDAFIAEHKTPAGDIGLASDPGAGSRRVRLKVTPRAGLAPFPNRRRRSGDSLVTPTA